MPKGIYPKGNTGLFKKGVTPWNKGKLRPEMTREKHPRWKGRKLCELCGKECRTTQNKLCSNKCRFEFLSAYNKKIKRIPPNTKGRAITWKDKISIANKKAYKNQDLRDAISKRCKNIPKLNFRGKNSGTWKGGVTPVNIKIRTSLEYKIWREEVFKRDNYLCVFCGFKGYVEADHIKSFAHYPELRFAIDNGRTLCKPCHKSTDNYGHKNNIKNKNKK